MNEDQGLKLEEEVLAIKGDYRIQHLHKAYFTRMDEQAKAAGALAYKLRMERRERMNSLAPKPAHVKTSAPMIVKNEEVTIQNAISSIHNYVDEVIVVDTGSTDKTMEYAEMFPRVKIYQKEFIPWDFSEARNYSLSLVGGKNIFIIDADEELDGFLFFDNSVGFINCIEMSAAGVPTTEVKVPRIFPMTDQLRYIGAVHNAPNFNPVLPWSMKRFSIRHWALLDDRKREAREKRTEEFIAKHEFKDLTDYYRYFQICISMKRIDEILRVWDDGYKLFKELNLYDKNRYPNYLLFRCTASMFKKDFWGWDHYLDEYFELVGRQLDAVFCMFTHKYASGKFQESLDLLDEYIYMCDNVPLDRPFIPRSTAHLKPMMEFKRDLLRYAFRKGIIK